MTPLTLYTATVWLLSPPSYIWRATSGPLDSSPPNWAPTTPSRTTFITTEKPRMSMTITQRNVRQPLDRLTGWAGCG